MADEINPLHRIFVAGGARSGQPEAPATSIDDGLPVLTDVVVDAVPVPGMVEAIAPTMSAEAVLPPDRVETLARELLFARLPTQRQALTEEVATWLDDQLPQVVLRVVDGLTDQIIAQVTAEARETLLPRLQMALEEHSQPSRDAD
jgi:hypothetical protein